jgi:threonine synthase
MPTDSPSMDIQVSSNFERLLFEESGRDSRFVMQAMANLRDMGAFEIPAPALVMMRERFSAHRVTRDDSASAMKRLFEETGILIDPHTAVGLAAARREQERRPGPMVVLGTAHPAKFPEAVKRATGRTAEIPERLQLRLCGQERFKLLPNSAKAVADTIETHASARHS